MATAQTIINRSLRLLGMIGAGESPTADETADALVALNAMLDSWRNERLMAYAISENTLTMTVGDSSYTIGPGGDLSITRPVKLEYVFFRVNGDDYPVLLVDKGRFDAIQDKAITSDWVEMAYYNPTMPTGTLNVWPVPSAANVMHIGVWEPFTEFATASDTVALPPGYERALAYNLAIEIAPEYGRSVSSEVAEVARISKGDIKRVNAPALIAYTEVGRMLSPHRSDIEAGE